MTGGRDKKCCAVQEVSYAFTAKYMRTQGGVYMYTHVGMICDRILMNDDKSKDLNQYECKQFISFDQQHDTEMDQKSQAKVTVNLH